MKPIVQFVVGSVALLGAATAATAQTPNVPLNGPVRYVSLSEYNTMVNEGKAFPVSPAVLTKQAEAAEAAYQKNLAVVQAYLNENPGLTGLAALVNTEPDTAPGNPNGTIDWGDGEYQVPITDSLGDKTSVQLLGQRDKIAAIAHSIQAAGDAKTQLKFYTSLYNHLPEAFLHSASAANLIHPSQLQDASLAEIQSAIKTVAGLTDTILTFLPPLDKVTTVSCGSEVGAGDAPQSTWGDRTQSAGCTKPSSTGIFANFNFPGKSDLTCVKNQGERGTCHIFAATSAMEESVARDLGKHVNLSEQSFQENVKLLWTPAYFNDGGDGGYDLIYAFLNSYPFAYEDQWDYNPAYSGTESSKTGYMNTCDTYPGFCSDSAPEASGICVTGMALCALVPAPVFGTTPYKALPPLPIPITPTDWSVTISLMRLWLGVESPVIMGFSATHNFEYGAPGGYIKYQTTDLHNPKTVLGGHMVHIVGYVKNSDLAKKVPTAPVGAGGGYFIIKNSWGACRGDAGYWYMPEAYLEAEVWDLWTLPAVID